MVLPHWTQHPFLALYVPASFYPIPGPHCTTSGQLHKCCGTKEGRQEDGRKERRTEGREGGKEKGRKEEMEGRKEEERKGRRQNEEEREEGGKVGF